MNSQPRPSPGITTLSLSTPGDHPSIDDPTGAGQTLIEDEPVALAHPPHHQSALRRFAIPAVMLLTSVVTTTAIGARFMQNFQDGLPPLVSDNDLWPWPWLLEDWHRFLLGWPFSAALLSILLIHEFGHYLACRYHGIPATLPWVLPAPTLSGTAGAVIQIQGTIPSRPALMDVGVYGPLVGYAASLVFLGLGFLSSVPEQAGHPHSLIGFGQPLTVSLMHHLANLVHPGTPAFNHANQHPMLIAGWIGLFITALNLIPGGQLDGGHILYALWPRVHRLTRFLVPCVLFACGIFFWMGWILWGIILLIPAMRHPRIPPAPTLTTRHRILGALALIVLLLTFTVAPFSNSSVLHYLR